LKTRRLKDNIYTNTHLKMFMSDLRIDCKPTLKERDKVHILQRVTELGWDAIAWTTTHVGAFNSSAVGSNVHKLVAPVALDVRQMREAMKRRSLLSSPYTKTAETVVAVKGGDSSKDSKVFSVKQYSRLHLVLDEVIDCNCLIQPTQQFAQSAAASSSSSVVGKFDIISVTPGNARVFAHLCKHANTTVHFDIISFDFAHKLPFTLNKKLVDEAISRGIHFEVCYSPLLGIPSSSSSSSSSSSAHTHSHARREIINNAKILITYLRGNMLLISSGIDDCVNKLRGPLDVCALASVCYGLNQQQCVAAYTTNTQNVLLHAASRQRRHAPIELLNRNDRGLLEKYPQLELAYIQSKLGVRENVTGSMLQADAAVNDDDDEHENEVEQSADNNADDMSTSSSSSSESDDAEDNASTNSNTTSNVNADVSSMYTSDSGTDDIGIMTLDNDNELEDDDNDDADVDDDNLSAPTKTNSERGDGDNEEEDEAEEDSEDGSNSGDKAMDDEGDDGGFLSFSNTQTPTATPKAISKQSQPLSASSTSSSSAMVRLLGKRKTELSPLKDKAVASSSSSGPAAKKSKSSSLTSQQQPQLQPQSLKTASSNAVTPSRTTPQQHQLQQRSASSGGTSGNKKTPMNPSKHGSSSNKKQMPSIGGGNRPKTPEEKLAVQLSLKNKLMSRKF
jgi:RNase P/RNase MRP subunit p30